MIFPKIFAIDIAQVDERVRIDASNSFLSGDEADITLIEIEPEAAAGYIDVTDNQYLDWSYSVEGDKVATLRITTDGSPVSTTKTIEIITAANDALFSNDNDLKNTEPDVFIYLPDGKSSFNYLHREVQSRILENLDERGIKDSDGNPLTKSALTRKEELRRWSMYWVLENIYRNQSNAIDDIFSIKSNEYKRLKEVAQSRSYLTLDLDGDGTADNNTGYYLRSIDVNLG